MRPKRGKSWSSVARAVAIRGDLDEQSLVRRAETAHISHQDRRGHDAHHGGHHMLQAQRDQFPQRRNALILED